MWAREAWYRQNIFLPHTWTHHVSLPNYDYFASARYLLFLLISTLHAIAFDGLVNNLGARAYILPQVPGSVR